MVKTNKYLDGKIYSLSSYSRPDLVYIGSTCKTLNRRLREHKYKFNSFNKGTYKKNLSSFEIIKLGDYHIDLIENFPCENRIQLHARETYFIRTMVCVNKKVSYLTEEERKEYDKNQKKTTCECGSTFRQNHKSKHVKSIEHINYLKNIVKTNY